MHCIFFALTGAFCELDGDDVNLFVLTVVLTDWIRWLQHRDYQTELSWQIQVVEPHNFIQKGEVGRKFWGRWDMHYIFFLPLLTWPFHLTAFYLGILLIYLGILLIDANVFLWHTRVTCNHVNFIVSEWK